MTPLPEFMLVMRGYDRDEVAALVALVDAAQDSPDPLVRSQAARALDEAAFTIRFRGYDRAAVQSYLAEARHHLQP
ncbi:hypothetical protein ACIB24_11265 [Spongisporangium articulatum]|uniref:DivIVA domain-containing protein n=1 Tax=Spongisporangium articulatum TaxID=3362603 RepID=A0ABW8ANF8_9ACTN